MSADKARLNSKMYIHLLIISGIFNGEFSFGYTVLSLVFLCVKMKDKWEENEEILPFCHCRCMPDQTGKSILNVWYHLLYLIYFYPAFYPQWESKAVYMKTLKTQENNIIIIIILIQKSKTPELGQYPLR